jgi:hypothetical protein
VVSGRAVINTLPREHFRWQQALILRVSAAAKSDSHAEQPADYPIHHGILDGHHKNNKYLPQYFRPFGSFQADGCWEKHVEHAVPIKQVLKMRLSWVSVLIISYAGESKRHTEPNQSEYAGGFLYSGHLVFNQQTPTIII